MRSLLLLTLALLLPGCGRKAPLLAHGKPVGHWVNALRDPDPRVRRKAVTALGHVGPADPAALPALSGALKDPDPSVRARVVLALLNLGRAARPAAPALEEARHDSSPQVREYAGLALKRIQGGR
jgi:HEAT repeat protein